MDQVLKEKIENAKYVRYIKLGTKGDLEKWIKDGRIVLVFKEVDHSASKEEIKKTYESLGKTPGTATRYANQIKSFYDHPEETLWITFSDNKLWWGFIDTEQQPYKDDEGNTLWAMEGGWRDTDLGGNMLTYENLSGMLLKTQAYRGTICDIQQNGPIDVQKYVKQKLCADIPDTVKEANENIQALLKSIQEMLKLLHPNDFEYFIDLIFMRSGWTKMTPGGGTEKFIDYDLVSPLTGQRAAVQVKSETTQKEFMQEYVQKLENYDQYDLMFYVYHTGNIEWNAEESEKTIYLLNVERIAEIILELGLVSLLYKKIS